MIKTFTADKDGYIKFTEKELKALLDEVYKEGQKNGKLITWSSPNTGYPTWYYSTTCSSATLTDTINISDITCSNESISVENSLKNSYTTNTSSSC